MHKATRTAIFLALPALVLLGPDARFSGAEVAPGILVHDGTAARVALLRWGIGRYERAGLRLPPLQVYFHDDMSGCRDLVGYYLAQRIDLCVDELDDVTARDTLLHEMGHSWVEQNMSETERERFMQLRGLPTWSSQEEFWPFRGWEQAPEIIAWGLGERVLTPKIPDHSPRELRFAFELLTGVPLPAR